MEVILIMNKLFVVAFSGLMLFAFISFSTSTFYSQQESFINTPTEKPLTHLCSNNEWNGYFENYREGILTKDEALIKLRTCNRW